MGEPVVYVPVDHDEALSALTEETGDVADALAILDQLRSCGYFICRAEP